MPKHIIRLLIILSLAIVAAIAARFFFMAPSFGQFGHYRADSVPDIAAQKPRFQGPAHCQVCHINRVTYWKAGKHATVSCEVCHGAGENHPAKSNISIPTNTVQLCSRCHEALPSRPSSSIKQVVIADHMGTQPCIDCHIPHSPTDFTWEDTKELIDQLKSGGVK